MKCNHLAVTIAMLTAGTSLAAMLCVPMTPNGAESRQPACAATSLYEQLVEAGLDPRTLIACYKQGTSAEVIERIERERFGDRETQYSNQGGRWSMTATDGPTGEVGDPITLTYSFPPDGWENRDGDTNNIHETLNAQFGSDAAWKAKFREAFDMRTATAGITYVEVPDDGAPTGSPGQIGARGDVRIIMAALFPGLLGFNFFPDDGDMTLTSIESWSGQPRMFTNIILHENGHGIGQRHVGPLSGTKLMEPLLGGSFLGPQDDEIRGANANYGDVMEPNNAPGDAIDLGAFSPGQTFTNLSLHNAADEDWFLVSASAGTLISASARPIGSTYLVAPCEFPCGGSFPSINTRAILALTIEIYNEVGDQMWRISQNPSGGGETTTVPIALPEGESQFLIRVSSQNETGDVQRYEINFPSVISEPRVLTVQSAGADDIVITAFPPDGTGLDAVMTPTDLLYSEGQTVTLTAPELATGVQFIQWLLDGEAQAPGITAVFFAVEGDRTATALFADAPVVDAGPNKTIVVGESVRLDGSATGGAPPYTFSWTPGEGIIGATTPTPAVSPNQTTVYTMRVVDSNLTTVIDTVRVEVLPALRVNAGANQFSVADGSFTLSGSATGAVEPYSYSWSPAAPLTEPNQAATRGSLTETTDFTLTVTDADGRQASDVVKAVVVSSITVDLGDDRQIRPGQSTRLTVRINGGLPPYSVQWSPAFLTTPVTTRSVLVKPNEDTVFGVLVSDSLGQESGDQVAVSLAEPLSVTATAQPSSVLLGQSTILTGAVAGGVPPFEYIWGPEEEVANPDSRQTELTPSVTRTYGLNVRDSLGQTGAASIRVVVTRPEQAQSTESALQSPEVPLPPLLQPNNCGLLGVAPLLALSLLPLRRRQMRR